MIVLKIGVGVFGYLIFIDSVSDMVFNNFLLGFYWIIVNVVVIVLLFMGYFFYMFVVFDMIEKLVLWYLIVRFFSYDGSCFSVLCVVLLCLMFIFLIIFMVVFVFYFIFFIVFIGSGISMVIVLIFFCFFYLKIFFWELKW